MGRTFEVTCMLIKKAALAAFLMEKQSFTITL
jgi:hypothetical protein